MSCLTEWPRVSVADVCETIVDCVNKTAPIVDQPTPYKMIRTTNVRDGWVDLNGLRCVDAATYEKWTRRQKPRRGDVILTREAPLGEIGMLRSDEHIFLGQRLVAYRANPIKLDNRYLLYAMLGDDMQGQIRSMGSGATIEHMRVPDCEKLTLRLPPLDTQRRIASILSAYDDLIENNTRRIAILEEMARRLYEEWFVRFRFPGHEGVRMVESELGLVPEGWGIKKVNDIVLRLPSGVVYKQADVSPEGTVPVIDQSTSELLGFHDNLPAHQASAAAPVVIFGDHTCKMQLMVTPFSLGPNTVPFVAKELAVHYVFWVVRGLIKTQEYKRHWSDLMKKSVIVAPVSIAQLFAEQVQSMAEFSELLKRKNRNLRTTRDLLLPKLISGELDVSTLPEPQAQTA